MSCFSADDVSGDGVPLFVLLSLEEAGRGVVGDGGDVANVGDVDNVADLVRLLFFFLVLEVDMGTVFGVFL